VAALFLALALAGCASVAARRDWRPPSRRSELDEGMQQGVEENCMVERVAASDHRLC
jgi:hypothetical protein